MAVTKSDFELTDGNDLLLGPSVVFVEVASNDVNIARQRLQVVVRFFGAEIS